jgi:hypothetical protein
MRSFGKKQETNNHKVYGILQARMKQIERERESKLLYFKSSSNIRKRRQKNARQSEIIH